MSAGKIKPFVDSIHQFEDALQAYDRLANGRPTGKVVVRVSSDE